MKLYRCKLDARPVYLFLVLFVCYAMTTNKLVKFLASTADFDKGLPPSRTTPIVLSDSKASYLKSQVETAIEHQILWWYHSGWTSEQGLKFLHENIDQAIRQYGKIHLYVWLGTCDLTLKSQRNGYIYLNLDHGASRLIHNFEKIVEVSKNKNFRATFLELPYYSIKNWNSNRGHRNPDSFDTQDSLLKDSVKLVNEHINRLNVQNRLNKPSFNVDLVRCRSNRGRRTKYFNNYNLYKDGIHPDVDLSKCWLRKITLQIRADCY